MVTTGAAVVETVVAFTLVGGNVCFWFLESAVESGDIITS